METCALFHVAQTHVGRGVFALQTLEPGQVILQFSGPLIPFTGTLAKGEREGDALQIDEDLFIDLQEPGVLVNHSCQPNAGVKDSRLLVALTKILPGTEITYDYSTTMGDGHWSMQACQCGSTLCRGLIRDFDRIPPERQDYYRSLGVVQAYLLRRPG